MIKKKKTSSNKEVNWFFFSTGLSHCLYSDYLQMKLCYMLEPLTLIPSSFVNMVEVVEKSFKIYLALKFEKDDTLSYFSEQYGHNLEKMRRDACQFNSIFEAEDIISFTKVFDDKSGQLYQELRYGSQKNIDGFSTRLCLLLPTVEKIFYICTHDHDDNKRRMINNSSFLFFLITNNTLDQSQNKELLLQAIKYKNEYFTKYEDYYKKLQEENDELMQKFNKMGLG
jgi:hypothetical protein